MENKINVAEILKDCPIGTKLYSPLCGECEIDHVKIRVPDKDSIIRIKYLINEGIQNYIAFYYDGTYLNLEKGECLLFPSKENRDWNTFKADKPKFDPKTLRPFDKVIARIDKFGYWSCELYSFIENGTNLIKGCGAYYKYCIPYNDDTKHLVGTTDEAPEYYRYWEN